MIKKKTLRPGNGEETACELTWAMEMQLKERAQQAIWRSLRSNNENRVRRPRLFIVCVLLGISPASEV